MNCVPKQRQGLEADFVCICFMVAALYCNVILKKVNNKEFSSEKYA